MPDELAIACRRTEGIRAMITPELLAKLRAKTAEERRTLLSLIELLLARGVEKYCCPDVAQPDFLGSRSNPKL